MIHSNPDSHPKRELKMDNTFVQGIINKEGYSVINKDLSESLNAEFLNGLFYGAVNLDAFNEVPSDDRHIVTGFGPTNSPTGGTLSMILRTLMLERELGTKSTIVISNLGAFNSRNIDIAKIGYYTCRYIGFIKSLGFKGEVRTHVSRNLQVASSITAKVLELKDFNDNQEITTELYKSLKIQGRDFSTLIDTNFTIADILLPVLSEGKSRVIVCSGIEEHYFPKLANLVLRRLDQQFPNIFCPNNAQVSALFGRLIRGLNGYPKMSKSIPSSSINLDDSRHILREKILSCREDDEGIILQMMKLVSGYSPAEVLSVQRAFNDGGEKWKLAKEEYSNYLLNIKNKWDETDIDYTFNAQDMFNPFE